MKTQVMSIVKMLVIVSVSLTSCKSGDVGPKGDTGATDPAGATGAVGATGATGATGAANVTYSPWFSTAAYKKVTILGTDNFVFDKTSPAITADVLNKGVILVYAKLNGYNDTFNLTENTVQLPYTITYKQFGVVNTDIWSFNATQGNLQFRFVSDQNQYAAGPNSSHLFRFIVIPGGVTSTRMANVDLNDYKAVKKAFNIPD